MAGTPTAENDANGPLCLGPPPSFAVHGELAMRSTFTVSLFLLTSLCIMSGCADRDAKPAARTGGNSDTGVTGTGGGTMNNPSGSGQSRGPAQTSGNATTGGVTPGLNDEPAGSLATRPGRDGAPSGNSSAANDGQTTAGSPSGTATTGSAPAVAGNPAGSTSPASGQANRSR